MAKAVFPISIRTTMSLMTNLPRDISPNQLWTQPAKTVKLGNDQHGFLQAFQQAAQKTGVTVPTHVLVLMSDAANAAAKTSG